jgi:ubiquinone/menaquinone biosynthesis C-methylase UbiE
MHAIEWSLYERFALNMVDFLKKPGNHIRLQQVLDLGSGSGRDCYLSSALVGAEGQVTGVDMTREQLDVSSGPRF